MPANRVDLDDAGRPDANMRLHHPAPHVVGVEAEGTFPETQRGDEIVQGPLVAFDVVDVGVAAGPRVVE